MAPHPDPRTNRILALLPEHEYERIEPLLTVLDGRHHDVVYPAGATIEHAWFPLTGVMSLIATDAEGHGVEMATVGREGLVGIGDALVGDGIVGDVIQQISGHNARIAIGPLRAEIERRGDLASVLGRYAIALVSQVGQGVLCVRYHGLEARTARWLLATHDRVGGDEFVLTQDFLSLMLGVTRPQVSLAAQALKRAGLIEYRRGRIEILDRRALEDAACECYASIRARFARLLGDPDGTAWVSVGG